LNGPREPDARNPANGRNLLKKRALCVVPRRAGSQINFHQQFQLVMDFKLHKQKQGGFKNRGSRNEPHIAFKPSDLPRWSRPPCGGVD